MSFNSYFFVLLFLPIAVIGYHTLNEKGHYTIGKWFLLLMSLWFYGYAGFQGLFLIAGLTVINYLIYRYGYKTKAAQIFMIAGIVADVLSLFYFKYLLYVELSMNKHWGTSFNHVTWAAPLGISFITFSQISFLVDSYRELDETPVSVTDYGLYVLFFPKVTVGPIALSKDFIPQINDTLRKKINWDNIARGLYGFSFGLAKKVLLADLLAQYVNWGYQHIEGLGTINAFIIMISYTLQIYFDFSGFCDMAYGIGLMLNFELPINFDSPYRALSIGEFWDRWHITLTKFFTKYIYIPLGGNRKGKVRTYLNILIVFLVSGIWHGANITFVVWGLLHGIGSCISRAIKGFSEKVPKIVRWLVTFLFVNVAWIFFRADSIDDAIALIKELVSFDFTRINIELIATATPKEYELVQWIFAEFTKVNTYYTGLPVILLVLFFSLFASIKMKNTKERVTDFAPGKRVVFVTVALLIWSIVSLSEVSQFIYVNF